MRKRPDPKPVPAKYFAAADLLRLTAQGDLLDREDGAPSIWFDLPWPAMELSPNAAIHYRTRANAVIRAKARVRAAVLEQMAASADTVAMAKALRDSGRALWLGLVFAAPSRRSYDIDNLVGRMKSSIDALADCMAINDKRFCVVSARLASRPVEGGAVRVTVSIATNEAPAEPAGEPTTTENEDG